MPGRILLLNRNHTGVTVRGAEQPDAGTRAGGVCVHTSKEDRISSNSIRPARCRRSVGGLDPRSRLERIDTRNTDWFSPPTSIWILAFGTAFGSPVVPSHLLKLDRNYYADPELLLLSIGAV